MDQQQTLLGDGVQCGADMVAEDVTNAWHHADAVVEYIHRETSVFELSLPAICPCARHVTEKVHPGNEEQGNEKNFLEPGGCNFTCQLWLRGVFFGNTNKDSWPHLLPENLLQGEIACPARVIGTVAHQQKGTVRVRCHEWGETATHALVIAG